LTKVGGKIVSLTGEVRTYLSIDDPDPEDTRATDGRVRLRGWLYTPPGTPPSDGFPIMVFNHGSEEDPSAKCVFANYFVAKKNFVLFVPVRRGHRGSTGEYYADYAERLADLSCSGDPGICGDSVHQQLVDYFKVSYLKEQKQDVVDAVKYVKTQTGVDSSKIAVMGHSFGGIVTLFYNTLDNTPDTKAVIDISGGAQSWESNSFVEDALKDAVDNAQHPIYFLQPKNDASTKPTGVLAKQAAARPLRFAAALFANVPDDLIQPCPRLDDDGNTLTCGDVAHAAFVTDKDQVEKWGDTVINFLNRFRFDE
jgi:pimeloyl-ACP methyl ester carboxylesterase